MSYESIKTQEWTATVTITFTLDADTWNGEDVPQEMIANAIEMAATSAIFDGIASEVLYGIASEVLYEEAGYVEAEDDDDEYDHDRIKNCRIGTTSARVTVRRVDIPDVVVSPPTSEGVPTLEASSNYWASRPVRT